MYYVLNQKEMKKLKHDECMLGKKEMRNKIFKILGTVLATRDMKYWKIEGQPSKGEKEVREDIEELLR